ncbi:MAG: dephospho-CoA kinase [Nocardioidaceae bacterium]
MTRVGLTGGIAAGKSRVAQLLAGKGAVIIDSDALAREVVAPGTTGLAEIVEQFGSDVLTSDGELDRPALGQLVFDDPEARARLEAIIHPRVRARAADIEREARSDAVVVHAIPLLVETGQAAGFDLVVVVDAPVDVQIRRLVNNRAMSKSAALARIAAQASRDDRRAVADYVISNGGPENDLVEAVDDLWVALTSQSPARN